MDPAIIPAHGEVSSSSSDEVSVLDDRTMVIGLVAGESSGDILGAGLIRSLRKRYPNALFAGIGGPEMEREGFHSLVPMERLSVMGLVEVLGRIRELVHIRRRVRDYFLQTTNPVVVIGIDSPDFTIGLELQLKQAGIPTAHYVSPSVWAWRQNRIRKIARAVDRMLTLFPFEARFYEEHDVPVSFVGHPLADDIPLEVDHDHAKRALGLDPEKPVLAILPGSRSGEVAKLGALFLDTADWVQKHVPDLQLVIPCVNSQRKRQLETLIDEREIKTPVRLVDGRSRAVMASADVVLLASGTATLEAMLLKRPMVVGYRMAAATFYLASRLVKISHVALPNLLAGKELVPEHLQDEATAEILGASVLRHLTDPEEAQSVADEFDRLHRELRRNASERAAEAVSELIGGRR